MGFEVKKVVLKNVRFGYEHLFEKSSPNEKSEPKYSLEVLIPKSDKEQIKQMEDAIKTCSDEFAKECKGGKLPKDFKVLFLDGDEDVEYPHREGNMFFNAKSAREVGIFGTERDEKGNLKPLVKGQVKGGDYGNVSVGVYAYKEGGIAFFLNGVQKKRDGEAISGGGSNGASDFNDLEDDTDANEEDLG